jgi:alcohol dehydrogenase class IV
MGIPTNGNNSRVVAEALGRKISELIGQMNLPQRLRDAHVDLKEDDLANLAQLGFQNRTVQNNPRPITDVEQIEQLLKDAW